MRIMTMVMMMMEMMMLVMMVMMMIRTLVQNRRSTLDGRLQENVFTKINCEERRWERFSQLSWDQAPILELAFTIFGVSVSIKKN